MSKRPARTLRTMSRAEILQRGEVGCGERSLAEGSCEVEEQGLGGAGLLVEAAGAGADGLAEGADGLGERDQGLGALLERSWWRVG